MLTSDLGSPRAGMPIVRIDSRTDQLTAEAKDACCFSLPGSYSFSSFHIPVRNSSARRNASRVSPSYDAYPLYPLW